MLSAHDQAIAQSLADLYTQSDLPESLLRRELLAAIDVHLNAQGEKTETGLDLGLSRAAAQLARAAQITASDAMRMIARVAHANHRRNVAASQKESETLMNSAAQKRSSFEITVDEVAADRRIHTTIVTTVLANACTLSSAKGGSLAATTLLSEKLGVEFEVAQQILARARADWPKPNRTAAQLRSNEVSKVALARGVSHDEASRQLASRGPDKMAVVRENALLISARHDISLGEAQSVALDLYDRAVEAKGTPGALRGGNGEVDLQGPDPKSLRPVNGDPSSFSVSIPTPLRQDIDVVAKLGVLGTRIEWAPADEPAAAYDRRKGLGNQTQMKEILTLVYMDSKNLRHTVRVFPHSPIKGDLYILDVESNLPAGVLKVSGR
jgi:hypothetical protein